MADTKKVQTEADLYSLPWDEEDKEVAEPLPPETVKEMQDEMAAINAAGGLKNWLS